VASRASKAMCDAGHGVAPTGLAVFMDFAAAIERYGRSRANAQGNHNPDKATIIALGEKVIDEKYDNLFSMYEKITGENAKKMPMKIYPAVHYTMGGLWVDYNLQTNIPGLFATGECNFSDHGANRLGASALMQGLADGYFVLPYTIGTFLAGEISTPPISTDLPEFAAAESETRARLLGFLTVNGKQSVESFHRRLGRIMWEYCGMARNAEGLTKARKMVQDLYAEFKSDLFVPGTLDEFNPELEKAARVADLFELGELMIVDALNRNESCGGHFRTEYQTEEGEAMRDDEGHAYVAAWEYDGMGKEPVMHREDLVFETVKPTSRSYK
jgi:succinate dehydrogenase / fumarate reductase, flavoprotein subunit